MHGIKHVFQPHNHRHKVRKGCGWRPLSQPYKQGAFNAWSVTYYLINYLPCLAFCPRCTTCEQWRSPAPDGLLTLVRPLRLPAGNPASCAGTPIGNLEDMSFRAIRVLKSVQLILAEDTRHTRKLLTHYGIATPSSSYHEHNEKDKLAMVIRRLQQGQVGSGSGRGRSGRGGTEAGGSRLQTRGSKSGHNTLHGNGRNGEGGERRVAGDVPAM